MQLYETNIVCPNPRCGKVFGDPLLLNDLTKTPAKSYYVCPHCIVKLDKIPTQSQSIPTQSQSIPTQSQSIPTQSQSIPTQSQTLDPVPIKPPKRLKKAGSPGCPNYFGYLKTRPANAPPPDECLICSKLLRCMVKK